jgi:hypothetical protein
MLSPYLNEFYSDPASKDGLSAECIGCQNPARAERERLTANRLNKEYRERKAARP